MNDKNYWKITEFGQLVGKHYNTVDRWFRELEKKGIHYIQRAGVGESEEKVFDNLDLQIGQYIVAQREKKWSLDAIFESLPDEFDLRPFPEDKRPQSNESQVMDVEAIKRELALSYEQVAAATMAKMRDELKKEILLSLPQPIDPLEERNRRLTEHITQRRVEAALEEEALAIWGQKPETERMIKTGWFRKEEDRDKRDQFVRAYINDRYEQKLKEAYGLEGKISKGGE